MKCPICGTPYYHDGRMGDSPVKMCRCPVGYDPKNGRPLYRPEGDPDDYWKYGQGGGRGR
jgi:hypothetical protein